MQYTNKRTKQQQNDSKDNNNLKITKKTIPLLDTQKLQKSLETRRTGLKREAKRVASVSTVFFVLFLFWVFKMNGKRDQHRYNET